MNLLKQNTEVHLWDVHTLKRCQDKVQQTLDNLDRREARFKTYCEFYKLGNGTQREQDELKRLMNETLFPIQDIYIIFSLLDPLEKAQIPKLEKNELEKRKADIQRLFFEAQAVQSESQALRRRPT